MSKRRPGQPIRVLIAEDSRSQRELLVRLLQAADHFEVIGTAVNGKEAVEQTLRLRPDVIAMDIHMPILDGYEATRQIMQQCPTPIVMISSSLGNEGRRSVEALAAGALAVLRKPGSMTRNDFEDDRLNMLKTLRLMADVPVVTRHPVRPPHHEGTVLFRKERSRQAVLAVAASTGGPAALHTLLSGLDKTFPLPILVVQHIARGFVGALVDWLNTSLPMQVRIAHHEETMQPGCIYLAPDDHHLLAARVGTIGLQLVSPSDRYCPSADTLFESVARVYERRAIGVIMTGMGDDGARGLQLLRSQGGQTLAQDEASCVVYGMPQAAVAAGAVGQVEPLANLAPSILRRVQSGTLYVPDE
ncbi:MAG: chemotaxis-specific protein-glutamate methyltransferase CheB [Chloroflexaceae bacterium]|nr:chemotaxis-specific protein-glutamate methyltransferase CheB [Chloroflexaceae bacterium]